jgi:hypothetical protein
MAHRIDHSTALADANGTGKDGFGEEHPTKTIVTADWLNDTCQEQICQTIEGDGDTLVKGTHTQLNTVMQRRVKGPSGGTSTDNAIARWDGTNGRLVQNSAVTVSDAGSVVATANVEAGAYVLAVNDVQITGSGEFVHAPAKPRTLELSHHSFKIPSGTYTVANTAYTFQTNSMYAMLDLSTFIRYGCVITSIKALVSPGAARSGSNRMYLSLVKRTGMSFGGSPSYGSSSVPVLTYDDGTTTGPQVITSGTISETVGSNRYVLFVGAGNTAGSANDGFHGVEIAFTDPGPRNY